ncbi:CsbD family protein [Nocardia sp. NPDC051787]|uniref:microaggregate-binding protein 1 n=1 Tax=Nocardia sp. NPDC051787 TaxID=3155415 RepID=UPI00342044B6
MPEHQSGPREAVEGVVEDIKGKTKEAAGVVTGDEDLKKEGRAQQDKADSEREAARKEAEAEKARAEADVDEARQGAFESSKDA